MTQRLAEVLIRVLTLIGITNFFSESSKLYSVAPDESSETGKATERKLHETQVEKL